MAKTILVVEDEWILADELCEQLSALGYQPVGPAPSVKKALSIIEGQSVDAALLDVTLNAETSFPIAEVLAGRGIPFIFLSGYVKADLPPSMQNNRIVSKPLPAKRLGPLLSEAFGPPS